MNKFKKIYILILLLLLVVGSIVCFSYAYFVSKNEEHGKLNIVVGELSYKIESDSLENRQITLAGGETKEFELKITSLNEIDSIYELYYTSTSDENITVYYSNEYDLPSDTITASGEKILYVRIVNDSESDVTVIFGVQGGLVNRTLTLNQGNKIDTVIPTCQYVAGDIVGTFSYTGSSQEFITQCDGMYKLEVWGAQGGQSPYGTQNVNGGGYSVGNVTLSAYTKLYVTVGGQGSVNGSGVSAAGGYNGGGKSGGSSVASWVASGGGATHIVKNKTGTLAEIGYEEFVTNGNGLIVAGGGGGTSQHNTGGTGGGTSGGSTGNGISGGTQTTGNAFGQGQGSPGSGYDFTSGAGGGFYGGMTDLVYTGGSKAGAGGSGWIGGVTDGSMENGVQLGNGYAQITYLGKNISYNIGDAVTLIDGSKWHVLEESDSDSETVTLLSDYNLNPSMTNSSDMYSSTCSSTDYTSCSMAFDPNGTNEYDVDDSNNIGYFIKNTYTKNLLEVLPETTNITLPTAEQILIADGQTFAEQTIYMNNSWLLTTNYWTTSKVVGDNSAVWIVYGSASAVNTADVYVSSYAGVRPVITVPKKYISN